MLMVSIILLLVSLLFESLLKIKLAPSNITWLFCCSMVLGIGSLWPLHKTVDVKQFIIYLERRKNCTLTISMKCGCVCYCIFVEANVIMSRV